MDKSPSTKSSRFSLSPARLLNGSSHRKPASSPLSRHPSPLRLSTSSSARGSMGGYPAPLLSPSTASEAPTLSRKLSFLPSTISDGDKRPNENINVTVRFRPLRYGRTRPSHTYWRRVRNAYWYLIRTSIRYFHHCLCPDCVRYATCTHVSL